MARKKKTDDAAETKAEKKEWPIEGVTVVLAHDAVPPTVDGKINIGMDYTVWVPDEETQRAGFTPYEMRGGRPFDMTQVLLRQFPGIYKPVKQKGD